MALRWPLGIAACLAVVVAVNLAMAWYAIQHPPTVVDSYATESR